MVTTTQSTAARHNKEQHICLLQGEAELNEVAISISKGSIKSVAAAVVVHDGIMSHFKMSGDTRVHFTGTGNVNTHTYTHQVSLQTSRVSTVTIRE